MSHLNQDQLILYHYGEVEGREQAAHHLHHCRECSAALDQLQAVLAAVDLDVPARDAGYEQRVWRRLQADMTAKPGFWQRLFSPTGLGLATAFAAVFLAAFFLGRGTVTSTDAPVLVEPAAVETAVMEPAGPDIGARVTNMAVNRHLASTSYFLRDLGNSQDWTNLDASHVKTTAHQLVADNRLYRGAAVRLGDRQLASFLDELELTLLEIANTGGLEVETIVHEDHTELLFKIRVLTLPKPKPPGKKI